MIYALTVSFALGIIFQNIFILHWSYTALIALVSAASLALWREQNKTHKIILCVLFCSFGMMRLSMTNTNPDPNLLNYVGKEISFIAQIVEEPDIRDSSNRYTVSIDQNSLGGDEKILVVSDRFPQYEYGDKISVSGKLDLPKNFTNDSGVNFDYVSYLAKDKIHFIIYRPKIEKIEGGASNKIVGALYKLKDNFVKNISIVVPEPSASLIAGVTVGAKQSLGESLLDDFKKVGLIHIIVLSGYNITLLVSWTLIATRKINGKKFEFAAVIIFVFLFAAMVGFGATVIRASVMAIIALLAKNYGRPNDALRALFITAFFMTVWNPMTLYADPSFQLSFMATLGLILFSPIVANIFYKAGLEKFITPKWDIREIVYSTLAVQIFLLPIIIRMSGFVSLISFLVNFLVLPFVPIIMYF